MGERQCTMCWGAGKRTCPGCYGRRHTSRLTASGDLDISPCVVCAGTGKARCYACHGRGTVYAPDAGPQVAVPQWPAPGPAQAAPPQKLSDDPLEGRWEGVQGGGAYVIQLVDGNYVVETWSPLGKVGGGQALRQGNAVLMRLQDPILGRHQIQFQLSPNQLYGTLAVFGIPMPIVLRRTWIPPMKERNLAAEFQAAAQEAVNAQQQGDLDTAHARFLAALEIARQTPEPDDDIQAVQLLILLGSRVDLPPATVKACVECVHAVAREGHRNAAIAQCVAFLLPMAATKGLEGSDDLLVPDARNLLETVLPMEVRVALVWATAHALLRQGKAADAEVAVGSIDRSLLNVGQRMQLAGLEGDIALASDDRKRAVSVLKQALERSEGAAPNDKMRVLQGLLTAAPAGHPELPGWIDAFQEIARGMEEPTGTFATIMVATQLARTRNFEAARELVAPIDRAALKKQVPPTLHGMLDHLLAQLDGVLEELPQHQ